MIKRFPHCYVSSGNRLYKRYKRNKILKSKLISWIDKRCMKCGKFINKMNNRRLCSKCGNKRKLEWWEEHKEAKKIYDRERHKIYDKLHKEERREYMFKYYRTHKEKWK